jgi:hypothetical protein
LELDKNKVNLACLTRVCLSLLILVLSSFFHFVAEASATRGVWHDSS